MKIYNILTVFNAAFLHFIKVWLVPNSRGSHTGREDLKDIKKTGDVLQPTLKMYYWGFKWS